MVYRILADLVLVLHFLFIVFIVAGGLVSLRWRWGFFVHLPAVFWGIFIEISGGICPLTPLENALRRAAGESGYAGGFVEHYLVSIIYPAGLSHTIQFVLAGLIVCANVLVYGLVWRHKSAGK